MGAGVTHLDRVHVDFEGRSVGEEQLIGEVVLPIRSLDRHGLGDDCRGHGCELRLGTDPRRPTRRSGTSGWPHAGRDERACQHGDCASKPFEHTSLPSGHLICVGVRWYPDVLHGPNPTLTRVANSYATFRAAKGEQRVFARGVPVNHSPSRTTFRAAAVARCCTWVLASPT